MALRFSQRAGLERREAGKREAGHVLWRRLEHLEGRFLRRGKLPLLHQNERFAVERPWILGRDLFHGGRLGRGLLGGALAQKMRNQREARSELKWHCLDGGAV